jgi:hypothetical protein
MIIVLESASSSTSVDWTFSPRSLNLIPQEDVCSNYTIGTHIRQTVYAPDEGKDPQTEKGTKKRSQSKDWEHFMLI